MDQLAQLESFTTQWQEHMCQTFKCQTAQLKLITVLLVKAYLIHFL